MLRLTLKRTQEQLSAFDYMTKCHKSFVINMDQGLSIIGNARGYFFESPQLPVRIPISRSKAGALKNKLAAAKE